MSKLNPQPTVAKGTSFNGNEQHVKSEEQQLFEIAVMILYGKDNYYETNATTLTRADALIRSIIKKGNPDFIANLIKIARTEMHIRSMPVIMAIQFAKALSDAKVQYAPLRNVITDVIQRADQITDLYAYALKVFGNGEYNGKKHIPMAVRRGVADAFLKFNEYNFAKYNRAGVVKLSDVLRIVHPAPKTEKQGQVLSRIISDTLETPYTWETELSINGTLPVGQRKTPKQLWTELVNSGKLGYMALLRNLRNIAQSEVDGDVISKVADNLSDPIAVGKSRQLPFRYLSAIKALEANNNTPTKLVRAINKALDVSFANVPSVGDKVWIIIDCSGSMSSAWGYGRSNNGPIIQPIEHACVFAAALIKAHKDSDQIKVTMFSDNAKHISVNPDDTLTSIADKLRSNVYGGGTNLEAALALKPKIGFEPDTVFVLSDMQVNSLSRKNIASLFTNECVKVAIDLAPYETTPVGELHGWLQLAGFSDRIFDMIPALREQNSIKKLLSKPYEAIGIPTKAVAVVDEDEVTA